MASATKPARADGRDDRTATALSVGIAAVLAALTIAVYAPVASFDFVNFDDPEYVTGNLHVRRGLSLDGVVWAVTASHSANWHPLTWVSHMLDCSLFGLAPAGHHVVNLAFHVGNTLLLLLFLYRTTAAFWPSALVAALFALHPLHVESVAWIAERKDVLSTFFFLLALLSYAAWVRQPSLGRYLLLALTFTLGLMAKPMVVTLPFVLLLLDVWPLRRSSWFLVPGPGFSEQEARPVHDNQKLGTRNQEHVLALVNEKLPLFALAGIASVVTYLVQHGSGAVLSLETLPFTFRAGNAIVGYAWYVHKTLWPSGLAVFYPMPAERLVDEIVAAALLLVVITLAALVSFRRYPYALVGWLWFLGMLLPVIGVIKAGEQSTADRFTYIPHIGLFIAAAWALRELGTRGRLVASAAAATATIIIGACVIATHDQLAHWRNGASLFRRALAVTSDNYVAHLNFGQILMSEGRPGEALEHFGAAVRLRPSWARAHNSYATALAAVGDEDAALEAYEEALRLDPTDHMAHLNRGLLLADRGVLDEAISAYTEALQLRPDYVKARLSMGIALASQGRREEAEVQYHAALRLEPASVIAHTNLGILLEDAGRRAEAIPHYTEAARLAAGDARTHYNLGSALEQAGQRSAAEQHYRDALRAASDFAPARAALEHLLAGTDASGATP